MGARRRHHVAAIGRTSRDLDVLLVGATGFTGKLALEYLLEKLKAMTSALKQQQKNPCLPDEWATHFSKVSAEPEFLPTWFPLFASRLQGKSESAHALLFCGAFWGLRLCCPSCRTC